MPKSQIRSLESIVSRLAPEAYYQSPGGRKMLISLALITGLADGARALDVQCGIGSASIDLAEAFGATVTAFDDYAPYLAFGKNQAASRNVSKQVTFQKVDGRDAIETIPADSYDLVIGLGGGLSDTIPGGLAGGLAAASTWLTRNGVVFLGDLVSPGPPSELMTIIFGSSLLSEDAYLQTIQDAGFDVMFSARSAGTDWDQMAATMEQLRKRSLDLGPDDERHRQRLTEAARTHPEIAYLNVAAIKR